MRLPSTVSRPKAAYLQKYDKFLIINADDFGCCKACNEAIKELFEAGKLHQASIMMNCGENTDEAAKWAAKHPRYYYAPHLTFTSEWYDRERFGWRPLAGGASIVDNDGRFYEYEKDFQANADQRDVRNEIEAQIRAFYSYGLKTYHADNHMGSLYGINPPAIEKITDAKVFLPKNNFLLKTTLEVLKKYNLAFRFPRNVLPENVPPDAELGDIPPIAVDILAKIYGLQAKKAGVRVIDHLIFPYEVKDFACYDEFYIATVERLKDIPEGVTETFFHPGKDGFDLKEMTGNSKQRIWEYKLLMDDDFWEELEEADIKVITYQEFVKYF